MPRTASKSVLQNKIVLLRLDLDLPIQDGQIIDDSRLKNVLPTIELCLNSASKVFILGHLGQPSGVDPSFSLLPVAQRLSKILQLPVPLFHDFHEVGEWRSGSSRLGMLENLRFWPGEQKNDSEFTINLAQLGEVFVNESFATSHREVASIVGLPKHLPSYLGPNFSHELKTISPIIDNPKRPIILILGGIKADKIEFVDNFITHFDQVLLGGGLVREITDRPKLIKAELTSDNLDITPASAQHFSRLISQAQTIVWNGPLGKFEDPHARQGTQIVAQAIASSPAAYKLAGGGDTLSAIHQLDLASKFDHLSTGGGALLYYLAHHTLPGLEAIDASTLLH